MNDSIMYFATHERESPISGMELFRNKIDYHLRMKGVPNKSIIHSAKKYFGGDFLKLYNTLYEGKKVNFDLLCKDDSGISQRTQFQFNKDYTIETSQKFERELQF